MPQHRLHHGGHDRFTLELEFVQMLANPQYLTYLADKKLLESDEFVAYLDYLQYFRDPTYLRYLQYPGPTLRALELLQDERFRKDILNPEVMGRLIQEGMDAGNSTG
ncbi:hypothetical protein CERZMDRAFT_44474 [Cercospora zeae-maydis SCOH1-5]|uniref:Mediator of RNA polymerase II transcription subunit 31 n=1 Tax=Cercospora zeae-maydis SCOH1-5 TaxID=717836 RepID=A0A6A6FBX1_9PEZI|nr:hypothetical protein CERZMDRAFT_44474 [Cercospora zeae-maydis SCOH1-5]